MVKDFPVRVDVELRGRSVKRVASSVGEGAITIREIHEYLTS